MPTTITPDLAELKRLYEAATPGPWFHEFYAFHYDIQTAPGYAVPSVLRERCEDDDMELGVDPAKAKRNAELIVAAHNAFPGLLAAAAERDVLRDALVATVAGRCYPCGWPFAKDGKRCKPGDCSFRPTERTHDTELWRTRQKWLMDTITKGDR